MSSQFGDDDEMYGAIRTVDAMQISLGRMPILSHEIVDMGNAMLYQEARHAEESVA